MNMGERVKLLRKENNLSQEEFGEKINIKAKAHISSLESGKRSVTDRIINDICREFNVNEDWLRNGTGEMFVDASVLSLDDYAKKCNATENDLDFIRRYLELEPNVRTALLNLFKEKI